MFKKKFLPVLIAFFAILLFPSFTYAQLDTTIDWDSNWEDWDNDYDYEYGIEDAELAAGTFAAIIAVTLIPAIVIGICSYVYMGITQSIIGKKLNYEKNWYSWVPFLNLVMLLQLADLSPWLILLGLIPFVNGIAILVLSVITMMRISEKLGRDKLLGLLSLIPIGNLVLMGILAWSKEDGEVKSVEKKEEDDMVPAELEKTEK